ncbi:MAG TPA: alpha/beta fold hydrolase [Puia sp.]|nr:alpha/beta fold hydrolase [Puia sp.]
MDKSIMDDGETFFYRDEGSGLPVMLVHGFAEDGTVWEEVAAGLKSGCRLLIPDLPGSGRSSFPPEETSMETLAAALIRLLDHEGVDRCVFIGHSMGGYVTLALAERYPLRVLAFGFFHSTAYADSDEKRSGRLKSMEFIRQHGAASYIRQSTPNLFAPATREQRPALVENMIRRYSDFSGDALVAYLKAMMQRRERLSVLERFTVLFIIGENDQVIPLEQSLKQSHLPEIAHIHLLPAAGHMGMLEDAKTGIEIIRSFLNFITNI